MTEKEALNFALLWASKNISHAFRRSCYKLRVCHILITARFIFFKSIDERRGKYRETIDIQHD